MLKSAGFTFIAKLLVAVLNFAVIIIISRFLGPADKGICSWYLVVIAISLVFSEAIAGPTAGFLLQRHPQNQVRHISYAWAAITSLLVTSLFFALHKITLVEWGLLGVLCWLNAANSIHLHLFLARQQLHFFNGLAVLMPFAIIIFLVIFFATGNLSKTYYLYSLLLAWGVSFFFGMLLFKESPVTMSKPSSYQALIKEGFQYGITNQASHLTGLLSNRLIFFMLPAGLLGIYSNALSLAEASMMIPGSIGQVMYASLLNERQVEKSSRTAVVNWWLTLILLVAAWVIVLLLPDTFYQFIFGKAFSGVKPYLVYLSAAILFYGCYLICSYWQSANGWFVNNFYATTAGLIVNAGISWAFFLGKAYTIQSGIIALGAGFFTMFLVSGFQFVRKTGGDKKIFSFPKSFEIRHLIKK
jgi:O-antigen/teichoic acid export membrane protein